MKTNDNLMYLLVRSPESGKKDSLFYGDRGLGLALVLKAQLLKRNHESTQLFVIDVERGICAAVEATLVT